jgi:hypothetical protein
MKTTINNPMIRETVTEIELDVNTVEEKKIEINIKPNTNKANISS